MGGEKMQINSLALQSDREVSKNVKGHIELNVT